MPKGIKKDTIPNGGYNKSPGRPKIEINWARVDNYLMAGASGRQVAAVLGIHPDTLYDAVKDKFGVVFSVYSLEKLEKGNANLLGKQFELAMGGEKTMLVWLGKNRCKQTDKIEQKIEGTIATTQKCILELPDNGRRYVGDSGKDSGSSGSTD